ncbi:DUF5958 family protein [Streptomyces sp. NBC_01016]|uniref:DUF5958 family protein n=1 Tax=Streptomyces sp. NBC_01016 TaxID=2903720 RepID=UPI00338D630F
MAGTSSEVGQALRREAERVVNEVAQELRTLDDGTSWFSALSSVGRQAVLQEVVGYVMQAHITAADGREGVARSGVKPTANPSAMICMDPPRYGFAALPAKACPVTDGSGEGKVDCGVPLVGLSVEGEVV